MEKECGVIDLARVVLNRLLIKLLNDLADLQTVRNLGNFVATTAHCQLLPAHRPRGHTRASPTLESRSA